MTPAEQARAQIDQRRQDELNGMRRYATDNSIPWDFHSERYWTDRIAEALPYPSRAGLREEPVPGTDWPIYRVAARRRRVGRRSTDRQGRTSPPRGPDRHPGEGGSVNVGIVGHEAAKFTSSGQIRARQIIRELLASPDAVLVSGHCHLGGIDIWAEEEAARLNRAMLIYPPKALDWSSGYKPRNLLIARDSDVVHCIVVDHLPSDYRGMTFSGCYHCHTTEHVKSGGCWTAKRGKEGVWHIIPNEERVT